MMSWDIEMGCDDDEMDLDYVREQAIYPFQWAISFCINLNEWEWQLKYDECFWVIIIKFYLNININRLFQVIKRTLD